MCVAQQQKQQQTRWECSQQSVTSEHSSSRREIKKKEIDHQTIPNLIYFHMKIAFIPGESSLLWMHQKQGNTLSITVIVESTIVSSYNV